LKWRLAEHLMPAIDLQHGPRSLSRYDVVGEHADPGLRLVSHVGLNYADNLYAQAGDDITAVHMRPPLEHGERMRVHVAGNVPLTNDEIKEVSAWLEEIIDEYHEAEIDGIRQYIIDPAWKDEQDPNTGVRRYRRYSCAGFVLDGHRQVDIELLDVEPSALPEVGLQEIARIYPMVREHLGSLRRLGLEGDGPWRIVLAGYVLHSLNRPTGRVRQGSYRAQPGNARF
jgi:hypothetical protein